MTVIYKVMLVAAALAAGAALADIASGLAAGATLLARDLLSHLGDD